MILRSATYQQASVDRAECRQVDPENRLVWRMNRKRLDFEALRDALLAASGQLDRTVGGAGGGADHDALAAPAHDLWLDRSPELAQPVSHVRLCQSRHAQPATIHDHGAATGAVPDEQSRSWPRSGAASLAARSELADWLTTRGQQSKQLYRLGIGPPADVGRERARPGIPRQRRARRCGRDDGNSGPGAAESAPAKLALPAGGDFRSGSDTCKSCCCRTNLCLSINVGRLNAH